MVETRVRGADIDQSTATGSPTENQIVINNPDAVPAININSIGAGLDIQGTSSNWNIDKDGNIVSNTIESTTIESTIVTGTPPLVVASSTLVVNLNAEFLSGKSAPSGTIVGTTDTQNLSNKTFTNQTIFNDDIVLAAGQNIFLDGGGDTFIKEFAANNVQLVVGNVSTFESTSSLVKTTVDFSIDPTNKLFLDGGGDTYLTEAGANEVHIVTNGSPNLIVKSGKVGINETLPASFLTVKASSATNSTFSVKPFSAGDGLDISVPSSGDRVTFNVGSGVPIMDLFRGAPGGLVVNEDGLSTVDFRVESLNQTNAIFLDSSADTLGIDVPTTFSSSLIVAATQKLFLDGGGDTFIQEVSANNLDFVTNGSTRVTIQSDGNLNLQNNQIINVGNVDGIDVGSHAHTGGSGGVQIDHGGLGGLGDNDHAQYPLKGSVETINGIWSFNGRITSNDSALINGINGSAIHSLRYSIGAVGRGSAGGGGSNGGNITSFFRNGVGDYTVTYTATRFIGTGVLIMPFNADNRGSAVEIITQSTTSCRFVIRRHQDIGSIPVDAEYTFLKIGS